MNRYCYITLHAWQIIMKGFLLFFLLISTSVHSVNFKILMCPGCDKTTEIDDQEYLDKQAEDIKCPHCNKWFSLGFFMLTSSKSGSSLPTTMGNLRLEDPTHQTSQPTRQEPHDPSLETNLDFTLLVRNALAIRGSNIVVSPPGILNSAVPLLRASNRDQELLNRTEQWRNPDQRLANSHHQAGSAVSGATGLRNFNLLLTKPYSTLSPELKSITDSSGSSVVNLDPANQNKQATTAISDFIRGSFPDDPAFASGLASSLNVSPNAALASVNVITFDGRWSTPFTETTSIVFYTPNARNTRMVSMQAMTANNIPVRYSSSSVNGIPAFGWQMVELPYQADRQGNTFRMIAILPPIKTPPGALNTELIRQLMEQSTQQEVTVTMPPFQLSDNHNLSGMAEPSIRGLFNTENYSPNLLTPPIDPNNIEASQNIIFETNATGSRAAAVTVTEVDEAYISGGTTVIFDRPFAVLIVDPPGGIHVYAEIHNPAETGQGSNRKKH